MSSYFVKARLKGETEYRQAMMIDDYFGAHIYGVSFNDTYTPGEKVYRVEECEF
jgi:hypothetical protein